MRGSKLLLLALLLVGFDPGITPAKGQPPSSNQGAIIVDLMDKHVGLIVDSALANKMNQQDLILSCSGSNCSREECMPLIDDLDTYNCTYSPDQVAGCNESSDPPVCHDVRVTFLKGYVRNPFVNTTPACEIRESICVQRALDPTFQTAAKELLAAFPGGYFHMYFGSVAGDFRYFPGREAVIRCTEVSYDPRSRLWYIEAINVVKNMVVLLDSGDLMQRQASAVDQTPAFNVAQQIIELLLNSSAVDGDLMSVIFFNSVASPYEAPVPVNLTNFSTSDSLQPLLAKVRGAPGPVGASNLTAGLEAARVNLNASGSPSCRIAVVFTHKDFDPSEFQQAINDTVTNGTELFIYVVGGDSTIRNASCYHFEALGSAPLQSLNPLFGLKSFFSFLARSRKQAFNGTNPRRWTRVYDSSTRIGLNQVITVALPALDVNGQLVGVAGIDLPISSVQNNSDLQGEVSTAWQTRETQIPSNVSGADLCQDHWQSYADNQSCEGVPLVAVCAPTSDLTNFQLLCCEGCGGSSVEGNTSICGASGQQCSVPSPASSPPVKIIVPAVVGSVVLLAVAGALAWYIRKKYFSEIPLPKPSQTLSPNPPDRSPDKL